jgi:hypothetical protein
MGVWVINISQVSDVAGHWLASAHKTVTWECLVVWFLFTSHFGLQSILPLLQTSHRYTSPFIAQESMEK